MDNAQVVVTQMLAKPEMLLPRINSLSLMISSLQQSDKKLTEKVKRALESGLLVGDKSFYFNELDEPNRTNIFRRIEITKQICKQRIDKLKRFISDETREEL